MIIDKKNSWRIFNAIAPKYDLLNVLLSWGIDKYWRKKAIKLINSKNQISLLDMATGTGDMIIEALKSSKNFTKIFGIDLSSSMIELAKNKLSSYNFSSKPYVDFFLMDAQNVSFEPQSFDVITIAFGIRNASDYRKVLSEAYRLLIDTGKFIILEFSLPKNFLIKTLYLYYLRFYVPLVGKLIAKNYSAYLYLNKTIETFPYGVKFVEEMKNAGFKKVTSTTMSFGIVTIYLGEKIDA